MDQELVPESPGLSHEAQDSQPENPGIYRAFLQEYVEQQRREMRQITESLDDINVRYVIPAMEAEVILVSGRKSHLSTWEIQPLLTSMGVYSWL